jgi:hypothetical protein
MSLELDIFNREILANKSSYETVSLPVMQDLNSYATQTQVQQVTSNLTNSLVSQTQLQQLTGNLVRSTSTLETPTTGISAINNVVALTQATYDALTVKLPTTLYVIV